MTENQLILEIISTYGMETQPKKLPTHRHTAVRVSHGSKLYPVDSRARCVYCHLHNTVKITQRKCPDCHLEPALCQTLERDCHSAWHSESFSVIRNLWYQHRSEKSSSVMGIDDSSSIRGRGRPRGSMNHSKRRGNYKNRSRK